jgi:hypothetical protein
MPWTSLGARTGGGFNPVDVDIPQGMPTAAIVAPAHRDDVGTALLQSRLASVLATG